jgi:putative membrane protein
VINMTENTAELDDAEQRRVQGDGRFLAVIAMVYAIFWVGLAVNPFDRFDWFLENLLVFLGWGVIAATYRRFPLSRASYGLIAVFLALHAVGAHYTYSLTPLGDLVRDLLGQERNHYDRFVHFAFGLLFIYPFMDLLERYVIRRQRVWRAILAVSLILALSGLYELIEWAAAMILDPGAALAFLGSQGDVFDGQKDAGLAFIGSLIGLAVAALVETRNRTRA